MRTLNDSAIGMSPKAPWNKGKLLGSKPPLQTKQVWAIRTKLQVDHRLRDFAMFNLATDSKLRGCDLVSLKVEDIAPNGLMSEVPGQSRHALPDVSWPSWATTGLMHRSK
jgi:hypothetical protein